MEGRGTCMKISALKGGAARKMLRHILGDLGSQIREKGWGLQVGVYKEPN